MGCKVVTELEHADQTEVGYTDEERHFPALKSL